ncbi:hypothetical protein ACJZ2D_014786 [Fusarium nematophilum]
MLMYAARLGESGLKISKIIMGCMVFGTSKWEGSPWTLDEEEGLELLKTAYDMGINTWDTADLYSNGASEEIVGKALKKRPPDPSSGPGNAPRRDYASAARCGHVRQGTVHWCQFNVDLEFARLQHIAELKGWTKFISMQNFYNLAYREEEREMIPFCKATGVGVIPWSPLARGLLTRPWGTAESDRARNDKFGAVWNATASGEVVGRVEELARKKGISMAKLSTAWVLRKGCWPILGLNKPARIEEAVEALQVRLTDDEVKYLEEEYKPRAVQGH